MQNRKTNDRVNFTSAMILRAAGGHDRALRKRAAIVRESEQTAFHPYHHSGTKVLPLLPSHQRDPTIHGLTIPSSPPQHLSSCSSQIVFRVSFSLTHSLYLLSLYSFPFLSRLTLRPQHRLYSSLFFYNASEIFSPLFLHSSSSSIALASALARYCPDCESEDGSEERTGISRAR